MRRLRQKIFKYCSEYIGSVRWIKALVMPALLVLVFSNYFQLCFLSLLSEISETEKDTLTCLGMSVLFYMLTYTLKCVVDVFNSYFVASSMRTGFSNFFQEYLSIKYSVFQKIGIGEAHFNIIRRSNALADFLTVLTISFVSNFFFFVFVLYNVNMSLRSTAVRMKLCAMVIGFILLNAFIQIYRSRIRRKVNDGLQKNSRKLYDILFNYERIIAYDTLDKESSNYWDSMEDQTKYASIYWTSYEATNIINGALFLLVYVYLLKDFHTSSDINKKTMNNFVLIVAKLKEKIIEISKNIDELFTTFTNLDQNHIEFSPKDELESPSLGAECKSSIKAVNLSFYYDSKLIFQNVNCRIRKGDKIAITGTNGNGKSTFTKILLGFYDYNGSLLMDEREVSSLSRKDLRDLIGYVPQNAQLFDTTVMNNLLLGSENISPEKVIDIGKLYGFHNEFKNIGYDKPVGDRGKNLSGGQRQKICFMRAIVRNAPILILDEPTANMDIISEQKLIQQIMTNMKSKTVIMIIHNISLLKNFDKVFYFDQHTLCGNDNLKNLYENNERFRKFYDDSISLE